MPYDFWKKINNKAVFDGGSWSIIYSALFIGRIWCQVLFWGGVGYSLVSTVIAYKHENMSSTHRAPHPCIPHA